MAIALPIEWPAKIAWPARAQFFPFDIKDKETCDLITAWRPQVMVHHAAQMSVRLSVEDPLHDARENILGSLNLLQAAVRAGVAKFIFASTGGAIYGDAAPVPAREADPALPECPYGVAKLAVEHYLHYYHREYGLVPISLRYANVFGPRQNGLGEAGVVAIFIEKFLAGQQPIINGDGLQTRVGGNVQTGGGNIDLTNGGNIDGDGTNNLSNFNNITANSKSFDIPHPTKEGWRLRYGNLEGPEHGVYFRGHATSNVIELPDYWIGLVHDTDWTVQLTPISGPCVHWVEKIENNKVYINCQDGNPNCYFTVFAERKDVPKVLLEYKPIKE